MGIMMYHVCINDINDIMCLKGRSGSHLMPLCEVAVAMGFEGKPVPGHLAVVVTGQQFVTGKSLSFHRGILLITTISCCFDGKLRVPHDNYANDALDRTDNHDRHDNADNMTVTKMLTMNMIYMINYDYIIVCI